MAEIPNLLPTVRLIRSSFPTPLGPFHAAFLMELARIIGRDLKQAVGLLRKPAGTRITLPDGTTVAQDIICFADGRIFDCLVDGEGEATPQWVEAVGSPVDVSRFYRVGGPPLPPPPEEPDKPDPSADELEQVWTEIHKIHKSLSDLTESLTGQCKKSADAAQQAMLDSASARQAVGKLADQMANLVVTGNTRGRGVAFLGSHYHELPLLPVVDRRTLPPELPKG